MGPRFCPIRGKEEIRETLAYLRGQVVRMRAKGWLDRNEFNVAETTGVPIFTYFR